RGASPGCRLGEPGSVPGPAVVGPGRMSLLLVALLLRAAAGDEEGQADGGQPGVLGDGGAVLGRADSVVLGHRVDGEVVRDEACGEGRQCGTGDAGGHERQQQGGADGDLTVGQELPELGGGHVLYHGHTVGGHLLEAGGGFLVEAELIDNGDEYDS